MHDDIDPEDLRRCRRGDLRGLEAIYAVYGDRVYRVCLNVLGQPADAEDAAQEVFLRVFDRARQFAGRSRFSTWIFRLTVNHCLNRRKERGRRPVLLSEVDEEVLDLTTPGAEPDASAQLEAADLVAQLLAPLSPAFRAMVVLRELEGLSYREIADVLDIPIGTVMSRLARARERLLELAQRRSSPVRQVMK